MTSDDAAAMARQDGPRRWAAEHGGSAQRTADGRPNPSPTQHGSAWSHRGQPAPHGGRIGHRAHVLLIEDDPAAAGLVTAMLHSGGYRVSWARQARTARRLLEAVRPDVVILEILLPDDDGLLLCSELHARWPTPIVVLSGTLRRGDRILSLRLGAADFIAKPADPEELLARLEAVLRRAPGAA